MKEDRTVIRKTVGALGAAVMFFGMFATAKRYTGYATSFFELGYGSWLLAPIAVIALFLSASKLYRWVWAPSLSSFAFMGYMLYKLQVEYLELKISMEREVAGSFFVDLERSVNDLQLSMYKIIPDAWVIISIGALITLGSMLIRVDKEAPKQ
ncbi:MAG: hypothetical protein HGB35_07010 [Geobacteraceae bacterium]|nr:hypothetical protein [Geobacteraceae bacterium]